MRTKVRSPNRREIEEKYVGLQVGSNDLKQKAGIEHVMGEIQDNRR